MAKSTDARRRPADGRIACPSRPSSIPAATEGSGAGLATSASVIDARRFRDVVGSFPTGVTVVTARGRGPAGLTTNAFTLALARPAARARLLRQRLAHAAGRARDRALRGQRPARRPGGPRRGLRLQARRRREVRRRSTHTERRTASRCSTTRWPGWSASVASCCRGGDHTIGIGARRPRSTSPTASRCSSCAATTARASQASGLGDRAQREERADRRGERHHAELAAHDLQRRPTAARPRAAAPTACASSRPRASSTVCAERMRNCSAKNHDRRPGSTA